MDIYELLRAEQKSKRRGEPLKEQYGRIEVDLSEARADEPLKISGDSVAIGFFDGTASTTYFKLNHKHSRKLYPSEVEKIYGKFGGLYLTNAAEAGKKLILYIGRDIFIFPSSAGKIRVLNIDGTSINPAKEDGNLAVIKTGIEIIDDWDLANRCKIDEQIGADIYSCTRTSTNTATHVTSGTHLLHDIVIKNTHASYEVLIGGSTPAFQLNGGASLGLRKIDLNKLFIKSKDSNEHAIIHIIGSQVY